MILMVLIATVAAAVGFKSLDAERRIGNEYTVDNSWIVYYAERRR